MLVAGCLWREFVSLCKQLSLHGRGHATLTRYRVQSTLFYEFGNGR